MDIIFDHECSNIRLIEFAQQHPIETSLINFSTSAKQNKNNIRFMAENMCITKYIVKCKMCLKFSMQCNTIVHNKLGSWKALNKLFHASCLFFIFDTILTMFITNFCYIIVLLKLRTTIHFFSYFLIYVYRILQLFLLY